MSVAAGRRVRVNRSGHAWSVTWGFADQLCSSLTNFGVFLVAGRTLGPAGLGVVFVGFASYLVALGFQRALITDPLVAGSAATEHGARSRATRGGLTMCVFGGSAAAAILAVAGLAVPGPLGRGLLLFAPWLVPALVQDFWRAVLFRDGRPVAAAANDGLWLLVMGMFVPLVWLGSDWPVVACWGAGATAGAILGLVQTRTRPVGCTAAIAWFRRHAWPLGRWLGLNSVVYSLGSYVTIFALAGVLGAKPLGGLRAVESVFAPLSLIVPALALPGLPAVSRALAASLPAARRLALRFGALAVVATIVYVVVLGFGRDWIVPIVFGQSFLGFTNLVWPVGCGQILSSTALAFGLILKAQRRGRTLFVSGAVGAVATLGLSVGLAMPFGVLGAAWGLAGGSGVAALVMASLALAATHPSQTAIVVIGRVWRALRMVGLYRNWRLALRNRLARRTTHGSVVYCLRSGARFSMEAGPQDVRVLNEVWLDRIYEPTSDFRIRDGWTVVDLGAHKGSFTVLAAASGPRTVVHAVEPAPGNLECLYRNLALNDLQNVRVYEGAVSTRSGAAELAVDAASSAQSSIVMERDFPGRVVVRTMCLDDLLSPIPGVIDFVKMDVEGAEYEVLRSAPAHVFNRIERIALEYHAVADQSAEEILEGLKEVLGRQGFRCAVAEGRPLLFAETTHGAGA